MVLCILYFANFEFDISGKFMQLPRFMISELDERMRDLKDELQSFEGEEYDENHRRKAIDALKRMENWNLFSDTHEVSIFP